MLLTFLIVSRATSLQDPWGDRYQPSYWRQTHHWFPCKCKAYEFRLLSGTCLLTFFTAYRIRQGWKWEGKVRCNISISSTSISNQMYIFPGLEEPMVWLSSRQFHVHRTRLVVTEFYCGQYSFLWTVPRCRLTLWKFDTVGWASLASCLFPGTVKLLVLTTAGRKIPWAHLSSKFRKRTKCR